MYKDYSCFKPSVLTKSRLIFGPCYSDFLLTMTSFIPSMDEIGVSSYKGNFKYSGHSDLKLPHLHIMRELFAKACLLNVNQYIMYSDAIIILRK